MENSKGSRMVMVITRIIIDKDIFSMIATSTKAGGSGIISNKMIVSTKNTTEYLNKLFIGCSVFLIYINISSLWLAL